MVSLICTGPLEPPQVKTWLHLLITKLLILVEVGIKAIDGTTKEVFMYKAHPTVIVADAVAAPQVLRLKGHTSRRGCRMCRKEGVKVGRTNIFYYPYCGYHNL